MNLAESEQAVALVEREVQRAMEPFVDLLSPDELEAMRAYLTDTLLLHPTVSEMVSRLVPRPPVLESGEVGDAPRAEKTGGLGGGKRG